MDLTYLLTGLTLVGVVTGAVLLQHKENRDEARANQRRRDRQEQLLAAYDRLMAEHERTLRLRLDQALYQDAYGRWIADKAHKELGYFRDEVLLPALRPQFDEDYQLVLGKFGEWVRGLDEEEESLVHVLERLGGPRGSDGRDYERLVATLLQLMGFDVRFTSVTGDQGVDLIAVRGDEQVAVQCKDYSKPVGNDAVQQVFAGAKFYEATCAMVIAPSDFTLAARQLASSLGVKCLHHGELAEVFGFRDRLSAEVE